MDIPDSEKAKRLSRLIKVRNLKVNIMLAGATGAGKSSTINALFNMDVAKVGVGVDPETSVIEKFELDNLTIWDTPGLGDGVASDERIRRSILEKLNELDEDGNPLIDLVVVILDSSSKDLGTSYDLINNLLIPALGDDAKDRILLALNQADVAMKGKHWNEEDNAPDEILKEFLRKKADSVRYRVKEASGLNIRPIYYCAGYKEEGFEDGVISRLEWGLVAGIEELIEKLKVGDVLEFNGGHTLESIKHVLILKVYADPYGYYYDGLWRSKEGRWRISRINSDQILHYHIFDGELNDDEKILFELRSYVLRADEKDSKASELFEPIYEI